jgi:hypothetical protein
MPPGTTPKPKLTRVCQLLQTGTLVGLASIPFLPVFGRPIGSDHHVAATALFVVAFLSSWQINRRGAPWRGIIGSLLAFLLFFVVVSIPRVH